MEWMTEHVVRLGYIIGRYTIYCLRPKSPSLVMRHLLETTASGYLQLAFLTGLDSQSVFKYYSLFSMNWIYSSEAQRLRRTCS